MDWTTKVFADPVYAQAIAAIFSAITAAVAVVVAIWNGVITRKNARSSVVPAFSAWADYPTRDQPTYRIVLGNKGFGPAIVESFDVFCDAEPVEGPVFEKVSNAINNAFRGYIAEIRQVSSCDRGHAFGAGEEIVLALFDVSPGVARAGTTAMMQPMQRLSLVLRYRDIYQRRWVFCIRALDGLTVRDSIWRPTYWSARRTHGRLIKPT